MTDKERRNALYALLVQRGNKWSKQRELAEYMHSVFGAYERPRGAEFHATTTRRAMSADIKAINASESYPKIIISGSRGVKIANADEIAAYLESEKKECSRKRAQISRLARKAAADQQLQLDGSFVEAFNS